MADPRTCLHNIVTSGYDAPFIYCASCGVDEPAIAGKLYTYDCIHHTWVCVPPSRVEIKQADKPSSSRMERT